MKFRVPLPILLWAVSASLSLAVEPKPLSQQAGEEAAVALIRAGKRPSGVDPRFVEAVRRIEASGGQFEFQSGGKLVGVDLASDRVSATNAEVPLLLALPNLEKVKLSGSGITGPGVEQLGAIAGLTEVSLLDVQIDNAGLGRLARLTNLGSLTIRRSPLLNDDGLKHLPRFPKLASLGLLEVGITDKGVALLAELPRLRLLDLRGCPQIGDAGLNRLRPMKNLRVLRLGGYQITDASLAIVGGLRSLTGLTIEEAAMTDAGLSHLVGLPLEECNLSRCYGVTDDGFRHFQNFANLRQFSIRDIPIAGSGLKCLRGKDKLTCLKLSGTGVNDAALEHLRGLSRLSRLDLHQTQVTDAALEVLGGMKSLRYLDIGQTGISDVGAKRLADSLPRCRIVHD